MESVKRYALGVIFHTGCLHSYEEVVLASDFDRVSAENLALQQRLTVQDQRVDDLAGLLSEFVSMQKADYAIRGGMSSRWAPLINRVEAVLNPTAEAASHE